MSSSGIWRGTVNGMRPMHRTDMITKVNHNYRVMYQSSDIKSQTCGFRQVWSES